MYFLRGRVFNLKSLLVVLNQPIIRMHMIKSAQFNKFSIIIFVLSFFILQASPISAQNTNADPDPFERFTFDTDLSYDNSIPSPAEFLGYELGQEYTHHYQVVAYFELLDSLSDRISVDEYAKSYEGRSLIYATISSEENMSQIDAIQKANKDLASAVTQPQENMPVVVWLSYNVHGNEPSSSESAMQAAYRLVAANDAETSNWREESVIIVDPMINPDGRDRYITWYKSSQAHVLNSDINDLEHDEIWPGGRTNHYWFDLNRDWVWLVHPESQGRISLYQQWMPQVHMDFHEQGANNNYFLMPGTTPRNYELPGNYEDYADVFGRGAVKRFDQAQVNYFTREAFDFFYPGYGSSYPSVMGGIGMLAEQGGHSRGGRAVGTDDGYVLTLRQRIFDHYINALSVVETAVAQREGLLDYFSEARKPSNQKGSIQAYLIENNDKDYTYDVINLLLKHGVEVYQTNQEQRVSSLYDYWDAKEQAKNIPAGTFVIPTEQPAHIFVHTLFRRQLEIRDSVMYDMSSWNVPMAFNLNAYWTTKKLTDLKKIVQAPTVQLTEFQKASYAYVMDWNQRYAPNALAKMLSAGFRVRSAAQSFTFNDKEYSRGSIIVLVGRNLGLGEVLHVEMENIMKEQLVQIDAFLTGRMDSGIDLASSDANPVTAPQVALIVDQPFNSYTAGQLWFLFDRWTEYGISRIRANRLSNIDMAEYDVMIFPGAWGGLEAALSQNDQERLKAWVGSGGVLVATEGTAAWLSADRSGFTNVSLHKKVEQEEQDEVKYIPYAERSERAGLQRIPGASFKSYVDTSHPLGYGMKEKLFTLKFSTDAFELTNELLAIGRYHENSSDILASGYSSDTNKQMAAGQSFAAVQNLGQGKVVLLLENTQYRMFWIGPSRMIQNAVFQLPAH